jgi:hypothetical protein
MPSAKHFATDSVRLPFAQIRAHTHASSSGMHNISHIFHVTCIARAGETSASKEFAHAQAHLRAVAFRSCCCVCTARSHVTLSMILLSQRTSQTASSRMPSYANLIQNFGSLLSMRQHRKRLVSQASTEEHIYRIWACIRTYTHKYRNVLSYVRMYVYSGMRAYIYMHMHACIHAGINTHTHTNIHLSPPKTKRNRNMYVCTFSPHLHDGIYCGCFQICNSTARGGRVMVYVCRIMA